MARKLRHQKKPHTIIEVSTRCIHGRLLLLPHEQLNLLILGIIGRAQKKYPKIRVYNFVFLSNHYHLHVSGPTVRDISLFLGYINANIAKEAGRFYDWREKFWSNGVSAIHL
jgi:hypothetical protein